MGLNQCCWASCRSHRIDLNGSIDSPTSTYSLFSVRYLLRNMCGFPATLLHQLGKDYGVTDFLAMYELAPEFV
jgi:hypothetical protein